MYNLAEADHYQIHDATVVKHLTNNKWRSTKTVTNHGKLPMRQV